MFTPLCKLFYLLQQRPRWLFSTACLATLLALIPLYHFRVRASVTDALPSDWKSVQAWKSFGRKFGSAGNLAVVVHSPDAARNAKAVTALAAALKTHPGINFLEYRTESDFYRQHKLLYISLEDLKEVERRVETGFWINRSKSNPLITNLLDADERTNAFDATGFEDLEAKYFSRLKDMAGSPDSTTLVLRIYPSFDVTDIHACRAFLAEVETAVRNLPGPAEGRPEVLYTGDVVRNVQNGGKLFSRVLATTRLALYLSGALLLINFLRFPMGALLALIPVAMASVWTAALTQIWLGPLGIVSAPLTLLLMGLGLSGAIHLLARYSEERRKRLSAAVAFETITLETGPAIAAGMLTLALAFLTFRATDFQVLADFGMIAGIGMICTLLAVLAVFPSLMRLVEPSGLLQPLGKRLYNSAGGAGDNPRPFRPARLFLVISAFLTIGLLWHGPQWRFLHNVDALGFKSSTVRADSLLQAAGEDLRSPAVFLAPDASTALAIARQLRARQARDGAENAIGDVTTLEDLLPADQDEKLRITERLRRSITAATLAKAREPLRSSLIKLTESWPTRPLDVADLPRNYRLKFQGQNETPGVFTYAFPAHDSVEGVNALRFAEQTRSVTLSGAQTLSDGRSSSTQTYFAGGWPVVYGELVTRMVPNSRKALIFGLTAILLVLWLTVGSLRGALVLFLPVLATLAWTLGVLKWADIKINPYNLIAFPVALAYATLHSLILYHRYEEEGRGSLPLVLRRAGRTAFVATAVGAAGFVPMAFSDHYGLSSLGVTALVGLGCSLLASVLLLGGILGVWEFRKRREKPIRRKRPVPPPDPRPTAPT